MIEDWWKVFSKEKRLELTEVIMALFNNGAKKLFPMRESDYKHDFLSTNLIRRVFIAVAPANYYFQLVCCFSIQISQKTV